VHRAAVEHRIPAPGPSPELALRRAADRPADLERLAVTHSPDLLVLVDAELRAVWLNGAAERVFGPGARDLIGTPIQDQVHPDDLGIAVGAIGETLRRDGHHLATRLRLLRTDGSVVDTRINATTFPHTGGTWMALSIRPVEEDVAIERRRAQLKALSQTVYLTCAGMRWYEEQERVVPLLAALGAVVGATSVEVAATHQRGGPLRICSAWAAPAGPEAPGVGDPFVPVASVEELRLVPCVVTHDTGTTVEVHLEPEADSTGVVRLRFEELLPPRWDDANADIVGLMASTLVMTIRRCAEERRVHDEATRDPLTRLLNRAALLERLEAVMDRTQPGYRPPVVLFADLNHFKALNDRLGHREGDRVLQTVGEALRSVIRSHDLAARIGGDEFVVVFDAPAETAGELVSRVRAAVDRAVAGWPGLSIAVGAIAVGPFGTPEDVLDRADRAMYRDKASTRSARPVDHRFAAGPSPRPGERS
jgi:diguanylate cyclase (GGDEF)-like protein/PAS domain S-box-containing protein